MVTTCQTCRLHQAMHFVNGMPLCCYCYMNDPNAVPADWHDVDMKIWHERQANKDNRSD